MSKVNPQMRVLAAGVRANVPTILWGDPGVAKSAIVESMFDAEGFHVEPVIASLRDPSDFAGLPIVSNGAVTFASPRWVGAVNEAEKSVVFLDEFSQATPSVQGSCLRVLNERWVGETKVGEHVRFILAANPPESAAGGFDLSAPTANRMLHIKDWTGPSVDDYTTGLTQGFDKITPNFDDIGVVEVSDERKAEKASFVAAYLLRNPQAIHDLPQDPAAAGQAWASRRSWEMLAKVLPFIADDDYEAILLAAQGTVGEGYGTEFAVWLKDADLPDPREVLDSEAKDYDFSDERLDRHFILLTSVVTLAANEGTEEAWKKAWGVLGEAAKNDRADIGVGASIKLMKAAKAGWLPPKEKVQAFLPVLKESGLISEMAPKKPAAKKATTAAKKAA